MKKLPNPRPLRDDEQITYEQMVGGAIAKLRVSRSLTQDQLRDGLRPYGIMWKHVKMSRIEQGSSHITLQELLIVANFFNVSPLKLLFPATEEAGAKIQWYDGRVIPAYETTRWMLHPEQGNADWHPLAIATMTVWDILKDTRRPKEERIALAERIREFVGAETSDLQELALRQVTEA